MEKSRNWRTIFRKAGMTMAIILAANGWTALASGNLDEEERSVVRLQVPVNLDFMLDPFEINGNGQVYSPDYYIKNTGTERLFLNLNEIQAVDNSADRVVFVQDESAVRHTKEKSLFLILAFDNGDEIILSTDGEEYEIVLDPDEELSFSITGALNEGAEREWREGDVRIRLTYHAELFLTDKKNDLPSEKETGTLPETELFPEETTGSAGGETVPAESSPAETETTVVESETLPSETEPEGETKPKESETVSEQESTPKESGTVSEGETIPKESETVPEGETPEESETVSEQESKPKESEMVSEQESTPEGSTEAPETESIPRESRTG